MIRIKALTTVFYGGKERKADDEFEATTRDAGILIAIGKAAQILTPPAPLASDSASSTRLPAKPRTAKPASDKPKRQYRRRDIRAEK